MWVGVGNPAGPRRSVARRRATRRHCRGGRGGRRLDGLRHRRRAPAALGDLLGAAPQLAQRDAQGIPLRRSSRSGMPRRASLGKAAPRALSACSIAMRDPVRPCGSCWPVSTASSSARRASRRAVSMTRQRDHQRTPSARACSSCRISARPSRSRTRRGRPRPIRAMTSLGFLPVRSANRVSASSSRSSPVEDPSTTAMRPSSRLTRSRRASSQSRAPATARSARPTRSSPSSARVSSSSSSAISMPGTLRPPVAHAHRTQVGHRPHPRV